MDSIPMDIKKLNIDKSSWKTTKLGELADDISLRVDNPSKSKYDRFVGLEHFVTGDLKIKNWGSTKNLGSSMKAFKTGDILFARRNAYLRRASMVDFEGCCSGDAFVIRENNDKVVPGFLAFVMNSDELWDYANSNAAGTMSKRVKWRDLAKYEFLLPPKEQQAQLAELIWAIDDVIEKENMFLEKLIVFKATSGKTYLSGDSQLKSGSKVNSKKVVEKWPIVNIEEIATKVTDGEHVTPKRTENGILLLSARNILNDRLDFTTVDYIPEEEFARISKRCNPEEGDILISCSGTVGRVCMVPKNIKFALVRSVALIKPNRELIHPEFLMYTLQSVAIQERINRTINKTAQPNLFLGQINRLKIALPEINEQKLVSNFMRALDDRINLCSARIASSQAIQKSLINQIF